MGKKTVHTICKKADFLQRWKEIKILFLDFWQIGNAFLKKVFFKEKKKKEVFDPLKEGDGLLKFSCGKKKTKYNIP